MMQKLPAGNQATVPREPMQKLPSGESPSLRAGTTAETNSSGKDAAKDATLIVPFGKLMAKPEHGRPVVNSHVQGMPKVSQPVSKMAVAIGMGPENNEQTSSANVVAHPALSLPGSPIDPFISLKISQERQPDTDILMRSTSADPTVEVIEVDLALSVETSLSVQPAPNARDMEPGLLTVPPRVDAKPVEMIARSAVQLGNEGSAVAQMMSAPSQASGIDSPRPVEQIAKAMSVLQVSDVSTNQTVGTRSAITIQLAPHHLGQVAMTMRQVGDVVEVRIVAETTSGLAALQSDENALKQVLRTLPVEQIRLDLSLRDDGSGANLSRNDQVGEQSRSNSGFSGERNEGRDRSRLISNSYDEAVVQSSSGSELNREPQSGSQTLV